jgi:hypothetical protein
MTWQWTEEEAGGGYVRFYVYGDEFKENPVEFFEAEVVPKLEEYYEIESLDIIEP